MLFTNRLASHDLCIGQMVEKHMQVQNRSSEEHQRVAKSFYIYPKNNVWYPEALISGLLTAKI